MSRDEKTTLSHTKLDKTNHRTTCTCNVHVKLHVHLLDEANPSEALHDKIASLKVCLQTLLHIIP